MSHYTPGEHRWAVTSRWIRVSSSAIQEQVCRGLENRRIRRRPRLGAIPYRDMTRPRHQPGRRRTRRQPLVFILPIMLLSLVALMFTAAPRAVLTTVSHGLSLGRPSHIKYRPCQLHRCTQPTPTPTPTVRVSNTPAPP